MYNAIKGNENIIYNSDGLPIGFYSVGSKNFNTERALHFLNKNKPKLNFNDFKSVMENRSSW